MKNEDHSIAFTKGHTYTAYQKPEDIYEDYSVWHFTNNQGNTEHLLENTDV